LRLALGGTEEATSVEGVGGGVSDDGETGEPTDEVQVWLVERDYTDKGMVSLAYATPDGARAWRRQLSANALSGGVRAARTVAPGKLTPVEGEVRERYASEAARVADRNDPDDLL
jgi:hypothetical protein